MGNSQPTGIDMALTDTKLKSLKAKDKSYSVSDDRGLFIEVLKTKKVWRMRYRLGGKQEKITFGEYPDVSLAEAREQREQARKLVAKGISPAQEKQKQKREELSLNTIADFAPVWFDEVAKQRNKNPTTIKSIIEKDIIPTIGKVKLSNCTVTDILKVTDKIKARGADHSALMARNILKRMFSYAISREKATFNPAAAIEAQYIAVAKSRDVALEPDEIGKLLRGIYTASFRRAFKLALHLLVITMVRKSELLNATWSEIDFKNSIWTIPADRMKKSKEHIVPLSRQALAMFEELKSLSSKSSYVLPSRNTLKKPTSKSALNYVVRSLDLDIRDFVIHDFRRTASTLLNESGFNSDWIEKALAHEQKGVRGVYNRAEYLEQRKEMLQWWADFVNEEIDEKSNVVIGQFGKEYKS